MQRAKKYLFRAFVILLVIILIFSAISLWGNLYLVDKVHPEPVVTYPDNSTSQLFRGFAVSLNSWLHGLPWKISYHRDWSGIELDWIPLENMTIFGGGDPDEQILDATSVAILKNASQDTVRVGFTDFHQTFFQVCVIVIPPGDEFTLLIGEDRLFTFFVDTNNQVISSPQWVDRVRMGNKAHQEFYML